MESSYNGNEKPLFFRENKIKALVLIPDIKNVITMLKIVKQLIVLPESLKPIKFKMLFIF